MRRSTVPVALAAAVLGMPVALAPGAPAHAAAVFVETNPSTVPAGDEIGLRASCDDNLTAATVASDAFGSRHRLAALRLPDRDGTGARAHQGGQLPGTAVLPGRRERDQHPARHRPGSAQPRTGHRWRRHGGRRHGSAADRRRSHGDGRRAAARDAGAATPANRAAMTRPRFSPKAPRRPPGHRSPGPHRATTARVTAGPPGHRLTACARHHRLPPTTTTRDPAVQAADLAGPAAPGAPRSRRGRRDRPGPPGPPATGLLAATLLLVGLFAVAAGLGQAAGFSWPHPSGARTGHHRGRSRCWIRAVRSA